MSDFEDYEPSGALACAGRKVIKGLHPSDFRKLASNKEITTDAGAAGYVHRVREPGATPVRCNLDRPWTEEEAQCIDDVYRFLDTLTLLQVDVQVGKGEPADHARFCLPAQHADLAYLAAQSFAPSPAAWIEHQSADITTIVLPEWEKVPPDLDRCVLVDANAGINYILGTDCYSDIRDAVLRLAALRANRQGRLALTAAAIELWVRSYKTGHVERNGLLFVGPDGTGKSTLACHDYELDTGAGEKVRIRQDGVAFIDPSGEVRGAETRGVFVRTCDLNLEEQPALYDACSARDVVLENVWIGSDGLVDYYDTTLTHHGRAVVPIRRIRNADGEIDMPPPTHLFVLTRNPWMPPVARLTAAQAAAAFLLGESLPSGSTEPDTLDCIQRKVTPGAPGLRPPEEDANALHEWLTATPNRNAYQLNTATVGVGEKAQNIRQSDTACIIREICREGVEWRRSEVHEFEVPVTIPGMDIEPLRTENRFDRDQLRADLEKLRKDRVGGSHKR